MGVRGCRWVRPVCNGRLLLGGLSGRVGSASAQDLAGRGAVVYCFEPENADRSPRLCCMRASS
jgi:hypothetical protein